ncbi:unnamed protein product [Dibothriocephalus latus]|uniref:NR LBD domain-containing protein n=1 Tax=Dibothriocephalus latus TaxID=60516 RepID=A0A3P7N9W2_DIBLA|nr:unnamed protein product [Dibothriocephalus latus]
MASKRASMLFFPPDAPGLIDAFNVDCTQTKIQGAFEEYLRYQLPHQSPLRFGHILLRLHGLRRVSKEVYEELLLPAKLRRASIDTFLETILRNELPSLHVNEKSPDFPYSTAIKGINPHVQLSVSRVPPLSGVEVGCLPMFAERNPVTTSLAQDPNGDSDQLGYMRTYLNPPPSLTKSPLLARAAVPTSRPGSGLDSADHRDQLREHIRRFMDQNLPSPFADFSTYLRSLSFERDLPNFHRPPTEDSSSGSQQWYLTERCRMAATGTSNTLLAGGKLTPDSCIAAAAAAYTHSVSSLIGCGPSGPKAQMVSRTEPKRS